MNILLGYPETGMGYQKVNVILKSKEVIKDVIVLNAEILELPDQYKDVKLEDIERIVLQGKYSK